MQRDKKRSIGTKFLAVIAGIVLMFLTIVVYSSWSYTYSQMSKLLADKAELALEFDLAIRSYVAEHVRPFAEEHVGQDNFIPEVMSTSFVARSIFEKVRKKFPDYIIKFSSDDPRNPRNQAGPEELEMIKYFNNNPDVKTWRGQFWLNGEAHLAVFSARRMKEKCLRCHGDPKDAPQSLLELYGDEDGFHRPVGEVVALDTVAIPVAKYKFAATMQAVKISLLALTGLGFLLVAVYYAFHGLVGRKLAAISEHFKNAAAQENGSLVSRIDYAGDDEIGVLAGSFNKMAENLVNKTTSVEKLDKEIAERKKAEEQVRQQNEFLNNVLESLTHPFYVIDANDYTIKIANSALYRGKLPEKTTCYMLTHKRDKPCNGSDDPCPLEEIKKTKRPVVIEHVHYDKDGNTRNVEVHAYPILDDKGNVSEIIEYTLDITERKQAEEKLKQIAEEWRTTFDSITDMVSIHDKDFKIVRANKSFAKAFNMKQEEIIGKTCYGLIHGTKEPPPYCPHIKTLATGKPNCAEFFDPHLGIHVEASTSPLFDENGQIMASVHIAKDITKRKTAEQHITLLNRLNEDLLRPYTLDNKLKRITDGVVEIFDADFCRVWVSKPGDLCDSVCIHAKVKQGPHVCRHRDLCLHLMVSSGRYTHIDGETHRRVPFGCYKIGRVAAG
ncbi:MAG: DUF3365 domain-containing protein, partial [Planctomycetota bacterium]